MQEVCSSLDANQLGPQIKSESQINALQQQAMQTKLVNNCDKRLDATAAYWMNAIPNNGNNGNGNGPTNVSPTESGFINSQPSMAEFMTHLDPESPKMIGNQGYNAMQGDQCDSVPEYPWMKEKKTARKGNQSQGRAQKSIFFQLTNFQVFPFKMHLKLMKRKMEKNNSQKLLESKIHLRILNKINRLHKISRN